MSENKHTPEPWRWEINLKSKSVQIVGGKPMYDKIVMDFDRWGMYGAVPRFNEKIAGNELNIMTRLCDRKDWIEPFEGRLHHADWCANVTHPDARRIVACVNACAGITTETLNTIGKWAEAGQETLRELHQIREQRDELLAALTNLIEEKQPLGIDRPAYQNAVALIFRIEEGAA